MTLLSLIIACTKTRDDFGNSYPWGPPSFYNIDQVSSSWSVIQRGSLNNGWSDLSLSLTWETIGQDLYEFNQLYNKEMKSAKSSSDYRNHYSFLNQQTDEARIARYEHPPYVNEWIDAIIDSDIIVQADKQLFGQQPGTNLAEHFVASSIYSYEYGDDSVYTDSFVVYSYPEFRVLDYFSEKKPASSLVDLFRVNTASIPKCVIRLKDLPEEQYDEITFEFSIDLSGWSILNYSTVPVNNPFEKVTKKTLEGAATLSF